MARAVARGAGGAASAPRARPPRPRRAQRRTRMLIPTTAPKAGAATFAPSKSTMPAAHLKRPLPATLRGRSREARAQIKAAVDALLDDEDKRAGMSPLCHAAWAAHLPRVREIAPLAGPERDAAVAASQTSDALLQERREAALQFWRERKRVTASEWKAPPGTPLPRSTGGERGRARHAMRSYHGMCAPSLGLTRTCCFWPK